MDEQDEIFTSPDLPAELSALSTWVENRERPPFRQRVRVPLLMALVLLLEFGLIFLFEDFINKPPEKMEKDKSVDVTLLDKVPPQLLMPPQIGRAHV